MLVIPALDIIAGRCVRLTQGDFGAVTTYADSPLAVAKEFAGQGAGRLHVIDLEGARAGSPVNAATILELARSVDVPLQVGGGIRTYTQAQAYLAHGIAKIIVSTAACENPMLLQRLVKDFGADRILVSLDVKAGQVATRGWLRQSAVSLSEMFAWLRRSGITTVIVTDTKKDGLLQGPNFDLISQGVAQGFALIAAGGITSSADAVECHKRGAAGVIVGKAMYESGFDLRSVQAVVRGANSLAKRIIPCLDVKAGRVVKGTHFRDLRDAGDPVELGARYSGAGADELVFLDITATQENRSTWRMLVAEIARAIAIPFTVGGGISSLADITALLQAGADKVSIGSAAVTNPVFIKEAANYFGNQALVVSIDAKRQAGRWQVYIHGGSRATDVDAVELARQMEQLGAGELLVNSLDRDGTRRGFDIELLQAITAHVRIPVIASSGAGKPEDFLAVFEQTGVAAALGASVFHNQEIAIDQLKQYLFDHHILIRL